MSLPTAIVEAAEPFVEWNNTIGVVTIEQFVVQVMGRPMEQVDRAGMLASLDPILSNDVLDAAGRRLLIDMVADGYPFPADLDVSPPVGGLAPPSQAQQTKRHYGL